MSPLTIACLLIVLGVIWFVVRASLKVLREWQRVSARLTMGEMPLLAALGLFAAWRCEMLLVPGERELAFPMILTHLVVALVVLIAVHRFRQP